jgi:hypothetical protein
VIIRRIFREYLTGKGIHSIAMGLNQDGIKPRRADWWRGETLAKIIANPAYMGVLRYGMSTLTTQAQRKQLKKFRVFFDEPRFAQVDGVFPAIISKDDFEKAQRTKELRATSGCRDRNADFLLSGIAKCKCGSRLQGDARLTANKRYYRCASSKSDNPHRCNAGMIAAGKLDEMVVSAVRETLAPENRAMLLASWEEQNAAKLKAVQEELQRLNASLAHLGKTRARFTADYKAGDLPAKLYASHCEDLDQDEQRLKAALVTLKDEAQRLLAGPSNLSEYDHFVQQLDSWEMLDYEERRQVLRHAIGRCVVYRQAEGPGNRLLNRNQVEVELEIRQLGS